MPLKSLKHIKVIVQVNTDEYEDDLNNCEATSDELDLSATSTSILSDHSHADITILDEKSLEINTTAHVETCRENFISQKMIFDYVCDSLKDLQTQLDDVMEKLLLQEDNCCLLRFTVQETNVTILFVEQLITSLSEHLQMYKCKMNNCDLICTDIWMVKADSHLCDIVGGDCPSPNFKGSKVLRNITNNFRNIPTLMKWLLNEYRSKSQAINSYEKLQFIFTIYDQNGKNSFTVNLYLYNIYVNLMTAQDRNHWHHYMLHMIDECSDEECNFVHSGLTVSLLSHLKGELSKHTYFLFDILTGVNSMEQIINVLKMADFIMKSRSKVQKALMEKSLNASTVSPYNCHRRTTNTLGGHNSRDATIIKTKGNTNDNKYSSNNNNNNNNSTTNNNIILTKIKDDDLSKLRLWYEKIDGYINKLCKSRDTYYAEYFDKKILNINNYVVALIHKYETENETLNVCEYSMRNHIDLLYNNYTKARKDFEKLYGDINESSHKNVLQTYFTIKNYDNEQKAKKLQVEYLKKFQANLNENIEQVILQINCDASIKN